MAPTRGPARSPARAAWSESWPTRRLIRLTTGAYSSSMGSSPTIFSCAAFRALPLLTKSIIRASTDEILSTEFRRAELGVHKTGGSTGVALTTYFDRDWIETRTADAMRSDQWAGLLPRHEGRFAVGQSPDSAIAEGAVARAAAGQVCLSRHHRPQRTEPV